MKTLGQIAYEGFVGHEYAGLPSWGSDDDSWHADWEAAAQAVATTVRAETIEECAKVCEVRSHNAPNIGRGMEAHSCAAAIRSLALEKP
jgi:hypothetical protein